MFWTHHNIRRILIDFVQKVSPNSHKIGKHDTFLGNDLTQDFGLSSMQIVELAAYVNSFFHFFETRNPPNLLVDPLLDNWVKKVLAVRTEKDEYLSFQSSGTSGNSKIISHSIEFINYEVNFLKGILHKPKRIISFVPANHIYGFLFTIVIPQYWDIPIIDVNQLDNLCFESDDLIIATPFHWQYIYNSFNHKTCNCTGVSSGAPLHDQLYNQLLNIGFDITEIFGSTETAGIGFRHKPFKAFELFSYWTFNANGKSIIRNYDHQEFELLDHINLQSSSYFTVDSRIDQVIQIGGVNISLINVQEKIKRIEFVRKANVYAKAIGTTVIIGVTISLYNQNEETKIKCIEEINQLLDPLEIPTNVTFIS